MLLTTIILNVVVYSSASAVPLGSVCGTSAAVNKDQGLFQLAAVIGKDDRRPIEKVAKELGLTPTEVLQIRKSVGFVICPGTTNHNPASSTGFLIGTDQKLMTVGHAFKDKKTGKWREPLSECFFRNQEIPPQTVKIDIKKDGEGLEVGSPSMSTDGSDYGFVKLKRPVTGAVPLKIEPIERELKANEEIILISAFQDGVRKPDLTQPIAQKCVIRDIGYYRSTTVKTTCDAKGGGSGSPIINRDQSGQLVIRGMISAASENEKDGEEYDTLTGNYAFGIGFDGKPLQMLNDFVSK